MGLLDQLLGSAYDTGRHINGYACRAIEDTLAGACLWRLSEVWFFL